jgi:hypothetical protein
VVESETYVDDDCDAVGKGEVIAELALHDIEVLMLLSSVYNGGREREYHWEGRYKLGLEGRRVGVLILRGRTEVCREFWEICEAQI